MIYIYRSQASKSARDLVRCLGDQGRRFRRCPDQTWVLNGHNRIVCWGEAYPGDVNLTLNGSPIRSKYDDIVTLTAAGVPTVLARLDRPAPVIPTDDVLETHATLINDLEHFLTMPVQRDTQLYQDIVAELGNNLTHFHQLLRRPPQPAVPDVEWLPRTNNHHGGNDLLSDDPITPAYWVKKENITEEYRVHSFLGKSIRAGIKIPREGIQAHEWIRSHAAGWRVSYSGVPQPVRDLAPRSVAALGLQFGAVDIARTADGRLLVLEVNRAPGVEGGTLEAYCAAITQWAHASN